MDPALLVCLAGAFAATLLVIPKWIRKASAMGLAGADMNKPKKPMVPEAGGVAVIAGTAFGLLLYVFLNTFYFDASAGFVVQVFAVLSTVLLAGFIGFIDDILGWKSGMSNSTKVLSTIPIAIPLAVANAGIGGMMIPLIGHVEFGIVFPMLIVPLGIIGAANGYNMLAGYNGLEAGMGVIILGTMAAVAWLSGSAWVSMIALCMAFPLVAFLLFNRPPARIFPGDSLTYPVGAMIACVAILGNMERLALLLFIPYFFDMAMFVRFRFVEGKRKVEAFAKVNPDGSLGMPHEKIYDFTHLAIRLAGMAKAKVYERDVVLTVLGIEALIALASFAAWLAGGF